MRVLVLALCLFVAAGCQTTPTQVYETYEINFRAMQEGAERPIALTENTVVVDVRSAFEYNMAHIPGSVNLRWEDFSDRQGRYPGQLKPDLKPEAHRLALLGLNPKSQVVVVGSATENKGAAGRMAWTLTSMGIENVQFVNIEYFKKIKLTNTQEPPRKNSKPWVIRQSPSLNVNKQEFLKAITARPDDPEYARVLDVRSEKEYFAKHGFGMGYSQPDIQALNIPWEEFVTKSGRPNLELAERLRGVGIEPGQRLIVISNGGIRSAAATMALLAMGYTNAGNFSAGYQALRVP